jgi:hypothetical protein
LKFPETTRILLAVPCGMASFKFRESSLVGDYETEYISPARFVEGPYVGISSNASAEAVA